MRQHEQPSRSPGAPIRVVKVGGDYALVADVVAVFVKRSGVVRFVVEDDRGLLMIYSGANLRLSTEEERGG